MAQRENDFICWAHCSKLIGNIGFIEKNDISLYRVIIKRIKYNLLRNMLNINLEGRYLQILSFYTFLICLNKYRLWKENSIWVHLNQTDDVCWGARYQILPRISSTASFIHLKLRRGSKEDYMEVKESKVRIGLQVSYKDYMLSWEWYGLFQRCVSHINTFWKIFIILNKYRFFISNCILEMTADNYQRAIMIINDDLFNFFIVTIGEIFQLHK